MGPRRNDRGRGQKERERERGRVLRTEMNIESAGVSGVTVTVVGNGHGDTSSNL